MVHVKCDMKLLDRVGLLEEVEAFLPGLCRYLDFPRAAHGALLQGHNIAL